MRLLAIMAILLTSIAGSQAEEAPPPDEHDIVLLPTEEFSFELTAWLARTLSEKTGLRIKASLPFGTRDWMPFGDGLQFDPQPLLVIALPAIERLKKSCGGQLYIILTTRDINTPEKNVRFYFGMHYSAPFKVSVISTARMDDNTGSEAIKLRLQKMILRTIGLQYYELERSTDITEVMYSPLMSLNDLDAMGTTLKAPNAKMTIPGR